MRVMGVEANSNKLSFVVVGDNGGEIVVYDKGRIELAETRQKTAMDLFASELRVVLERNSLDLVIVKLKPEKGQMRAGAASLKMEAALMLCATCDVRFTSGKKLLTIEEPDRLFSYLKVSWKVAVLGLNSLKE